MCSCFNQSAYAREKVEQNKQWQSPFGFLTIATIVMAVTFSAWNALLNNFAVEAAQFNGANMGRGSRGFHRSLH